MLLGDHLDPGYCQLIGDSETVGAVLLAAGSSARMDGVDKQLLTLRGWPVFIHSLRVLDDSSQIDSICVVFSVRNFEAGKQALAGECFSKVIATVVGGARRQDSVKLGIEALTATEHAPDWLVIHDAARPFVDEAMIGRGLIAARETGASVTAVPLKDTVKQVTEHTVVATPDRDHLRIVQTPQVFLASTLIEAHSAVTADVTDDASMVEKIGGTVTVFDGGYDNIKITTPDDIAIANAIYDRKHGQPVDQIARRWGIGFDGHSLVDGGPLRLGGVEIEFDKRLEGHSDGDVLLHAVTSALLGAAGLGDMGSNFPSSDKSLAGIDSAELLTRSLQKIRESGWEPEHLDATIIAQQPRLSGHVEAITNRIAGVISLDKASVNIKVTSTDHVGAIGEGRGIAAQAVATIRLT